MIHCTCNVKGNEVLKKLVKEKFGLNDKQVEELLEIFSAFFFLEPTKTSKLSQKQIEGFSQHSATEIARILISEGVSNEQAILFAQLIKPFEESSSSF